MRSHMRSSVSTLSLICTIKVLRFQSVLTQTKHQQCRSPKEAEKQANQNTNMDTSTTCETFIQVYVTEIVVTWRLHHYHMEVILKIC